MNKLPHIAVTMGDPAGIGPELCLQLLSRDPQPLGAIPIIFGDASLLRRVAQETSLPFTAPILQNSHPLAALPPVPAVLDLALPGIVNVPSGVVSPQAGQAAMQAILRAIQAAKDGAVAGVATNPIHKEALAAAGIPFPGHTEIFAHETGTREYCMMLASEELAVSLVTIHVPYAAVPGLLTPAAVLRTLRLTAAAMEQIHHRPPRLTVCALNPHAGEHGLFGSEEETCILPALQQATAEGLQVTGPLPPDTAFIPARRRHTDAYIAMYHDQGLIPFKILAFERGVNITLGLPIVRTSVDHGTAFDLARRGLASSASLEEAVRWAARLANHDPCTT